MKAIPEIKVLAECVDIRSGKRFLAGEVFKPLPTEEQAKRLVEAKCLPETAIEFAKANDSAAAKEREKQDAEAEKRAATAALLVAANTELAEARSAAETAQSAFDTASEDKKAEAATALNDAKARLASAEQAIKKLSK